MESAATKTAVKPNVGTIFMLAELGSGVVEGAWVATEASLAAPVAALAFADASDDALAETKLLASAAADEAWPITDCKTVGTLWVADWTLLVMAELAVSVLPMMMLVSELAAEAVAATLDSELVAVALASALAVVASALAVVAAALAVLAAVVSCELVAVVAGAVVAASVPWATLGHPPIQLR